MLILIPEFPLITTCLFKQGSMASIPTIAQEAVLVRSGALPVDPVEVKGYDFNNGVDYHSLLKSFHTTGFQATNFALAVDEINKMVILLPFNLGNCNLLSIVCTAHAIKIICKFIVVK